MLHVWTIYIYLHISAYFNLQAYLYCRCDIHVLYITAFVEMVLHIGQVPMLVNNKACAKK